MFAVAACCALVALSVRESQAARLQPEDFTYMGAFRLPDPQPGAPENYNWTWNGWSSAMAFYPEGDPDGENDGFPGSIFGVGHGHAQCVSEIAIPQPVVSAAKNLNELNTAETLQPFADIKGGMFGELELPRVGLACLPAQGSQTSDKLYFAIANHMGDGEANPSHGWCEITLSNPQSKGLWRVGEYVNFVTGDYIFPIPQAWSDVYAPGMRLATGRMRDGGQGSEGPSILAIAPWNDGNPPANGATLQATPLLLYESFYDAENPVALNDYHHSDEWSGAAWLVSGQASSVIFTGTKGQGDCWYGWADGTVYSPDSEIEGEGERGWWSSSFEGQILFFDTDELGEIALGQRASSSVQPYAVMQIDDYLYGVTSTQMKTHVGAAAFDENNGLFYVFEPMVDEDKSIVHVWRVATGLRSQLAGGVPSPADYDGDGVDDVAVYTESTGYWTILFSNDGSTSTAKWGASGYVPVPEDFDGDSKSDLSVYCESGDWPGYWYVLSSSDYSMSSAKFGDTGYVPLPADYDGDGVVDLAVYCESGDWPGYWYILNSSDYSMSYMKWGASGYTPVPADYDGDGMADVAVYCELGDMPGYWFISLSSSSEMYYMPFGAAGYMPAAGDYDGDGITDLSVYNPTTGNWYAMSLDGRTLVWIE